MLDCCNEDDVIEKIPRTSGGQAGCSPLRSLFRASQQRSQVGLLEGDRILAKLLGRANSARQEELDNKNRPVRDGGIYKEYLTKSSYTSHIYINYATY